MRAGRAGGAGAGLHDEVGQGCVELVSVGPDDGVRTPFDDDEGGGPSQRGQPLAGELDGHDAVLVTLDDQDREL